MSAKNLLFIYTDEQTFKTLKAYGNDQMAMPNLDRLARQSVVFDETYVTQPICTPSRSTLLTGLYPHTNGCVKNNVPLNPETPCLPEMLTRGDHVTAHYGKWHLGDELHAQHGFQEWIGIEDAYNDYFSEGKDRDIRSGYHHFLIEHGFVPKNGSNFGRAEAARLPEEYGKPAFLAQEATRFLRTNKDNPFVLFVGFLEPHMPYFGPRDGQYDPADIPLPANFDAVPGPAQPLKARLLQQHFARVGHSGLPLSNPDEWRRMIANYWGLCSLIDTHVGTILDTLDECGLSENTLVVFTSDHGDMMGAHRLLAKCVMYQESIRVPFMIRKPGQTEGTRVTGPVSQIDLVPTLLDLMGEAVPESLQGKSLRPRMEHPDQLSREPAFVEWNGPVMAKLKMQDWMQELGTPEEIRAGCTDPVRTIITADGWKFNCSPLGEHELYNLTDDPFETENVFEQERALARQLREQIVQWQKDTGDFVVLPTV